jgi:hypothetical protein
MGTEPSVNLCFRSGKVGTVSTNPDRDKLESRTLQEWPELAHLSRPIRVSEVIALSSRFVLVLERCCLEKRRVNPIRSALSELHPCSRVGGC